MTLVQGDLPYCERHKQDFVPTFAPARIAGKEGGTMKRDEIVRKLRAERDHLREKFGVASLALFGSLARDEAEPGSDVDLLVEFARPITLFDLVAIQQYLERCLGVSRVDVVPRDSVYPAFRESILEGAVNVG
jgi:uncharacterized protein